MLGKLHHSLVEGTWALGEVTHRGLGWSQEVEREDMQNNPGFRTQFWQSEGRALLPSFLHGSFVFRSPTEEASSKQQGWGQSPPSQRKLSTGCVTAVTLFRSNKCRRRMTWGWCSPAPGLIGSSSGLNAEVSWQREAEEPDFRVPALGARQVLGKGRRRGARSGALGHRPSSSRYPLRGPGPYSSHGSGVGMSFAHFALRVSGGHRQR